MSVRRKTENRLTLYRTCHTCGKQFFTTAATPFVRQLCNVDGKKQKICYFCSEVCKNASYIHKGWCGEKAEDRRKIREQNRDSTAKNKLYYSEHAEQERQRACKRYWADPDAARLANRYSKEKRKLLDGYSPELTCERCGEKFVRTSPASRFCPACRPKRKRERKRLRRKEKREQLMSLVGVCDADV